jgi:hypothetical protein
MRQPFKFDVDSSPVNSGVRLLKEMLVEEKP